MRKLLASLVLAAIGCTSQPRIEAPKLIQPIKEVTQKSPEQSKPIKLYVNKGLPHYSIKKSQLEGEKDLVTLALTSDVEEMWVFDRKEGIWYECGIEEKALLVKSDNRGIESRISDCIDYHLHLPSSESKKKVYNIAAVAFPSMPEDFKDCFDNEARDAIVSEYGVVEFFNLLPEKKSWEQTKKKWRKTLKKINEEYYPIIVLSLNKKLKSGSSEKEAIKYAVDKVNERFNEKVRLIYRPSNK